MTESTTFYWYDFETFGLDCRRDRPAQFAGIRTDMDLNPQGDGDVFYSRPSGDYLPSPESCLLTGMTPQICEERGIPESEFAGEVWSRLNRPGTISIGYNASGFDNEVARFLFWRNFLDPYSHQHRNGCSCWDLYPLVCAVWALRGDGIEWPLRKDVDPESNDEKSVSFRLECLSKANGIVHAHSHEALSDAMATLGLAALIRKTEPRLWKWALENRSREAVKAAVTKGPVVWISPKFGQARGFLRIAARIPFPGESGNSALMWDLSVDPLIVTKLSDEEIKSRLFARREDLADGEEPLPVYRLAMNNSPFVCANLKVLSPERMDRFGVKPQEILANWERFKELGNVIAGRLAGLMGRRERPAPKDVDFGLYDGGFASGHDVEMMARVRGMTPESLAKGSIHFDDERFNQLLVRYRARNWQETLNDEERSQWTFFCRSRLMDGADGALTVSAYFDEIDRLQESTLEDEEKQLVLEALYEWGERAGEACAF